MADPQLVVCPACSAVNRVPAARIGAGPNCGRCKEPLFRNAPIDVNGAAFDRHVRQGTLPVLADFWASWCGPCRAMAPSFKAAAATLEPDMRLVKIDTESEPELAARYAIRSIPTLMLFKDGREIARAAGAMDREALIRWARQNLAA